MRMIILDEEQRKEYEMPEGLSVIECLLRYDLPVRNDCAAKGNCGKCRVRAIAGDLSPETEIEREHLSKEELDQGWFLACQRTAKSDVTLRLSYGRDAGYRKTMLAEKEDALAGDPVVQRGVFSMSEPDLSDQVPDWERLLAAVGGSVSREAIPRGLLSALPELLRKEDFTVTVTTVANRLAAVTPGKSERRPFGAVCDIGTTTLAVYLVDLATGITRGAAAKTNPQVSFGTDVISRINSVSEDFSALEKMHGDIVAAIAELMAGLLEENDLSADDLFAMTVVGNTTMSHLFAKADPRRLATAPFVFCFKQGLTFRGRDLPLPMHPEGEVFLLPNVAGYVGSDTVGVMLSVDILNRSGCSIAVDLGTNGEIVLSGNGRVLACSTAAGPAFEGAKIKNGMRAGAGAIEKVRISDGEIELKIIDEAPPAGICGSGLIDAAAQMLKAGLIDASGCLLPPDTDFPLAENLRRRLRKGDQGLDEFVLAAKGEYGNDADVVISQKDIRELQLGKGAVAAGITVLLREMNITAEEVDRLFLAGAFGNYMDVRHAVMLGLFPGISVEKVEAVGNAAAYGGRLALLSREKRAAAEELAEKTEHIELSTSAAFYDIFMREMNFPG